MTDIRFETKTCACGNRYKSRNFENITDKVNRSATLIDMTGNNDEFVIMCEPENLVLKFKPPDGNPGMVFTTGEFTFKQYLKTLETGGEIDVDFSQVDTDCERRNVAYTLTTEDICGFSKKVLAMICQWDNPPEKVKSLSDTLNESKEKANG